VDRAYRGCPLPTAPATGLPESTRTPPGGRPLHQRRLGPGAGAAYPPIGAERERGHGAVVTGHNGVSCAATATALPRAWLANSARTWVTRLPRIAAMSIVIVAALPLATAPNTPRATRSKACRRASGASGGPGDQDGSRADLTHRGSPPAAEALVRPGDQCRGHAFTSRARRRLPGRCQWARPCRSWPSGRCSGR
jgi:hypothetical protein